MIAPELELLERVASNDLDMAVVCGKPVLGELKSRLVCRDELVLVTGSTSPLAGRRQATARDLQDAHWIMREDGSDTKRQLDVWFRRHRVTAAHTMTLQGPDAVKRAVLAGLGIGLLAKRVVRDELKAGRLVALRTAAAFPARDVLLVDHPHKHHGAACTAMLTILNAG
jgi:DNA-binding transcriptional LysR family regulator